MGPVHTAVMRSSKGANTLGTLRRAQRDAEQENPILLRFCAKGAKLA
jgi:hypothetical protein